MTLDEEIAWWTNVMHQHSNEIGFVALGMASGLKLAKAEYGARNDPVPSGTLTANSASTISTPRRRCGGR